MSRFKFSRLVEERFGPEFRKIGVFAGEPAVGVRDERDDMECTECGMMKIEGACGCAGHEEGNVCAGCGMMPIDGSCGCDHSEDACQTCGMKGGGCGHEVTEVAPEGGEHVVKALKKKKDIDNPWALAWSMKNKGYI